jgi:hypothetical protein
MESRSTKGSDSQGTAETRLKMSAETTARRTHNAGGVKLGQ